MSLLLHFELKHSKQDRAAAHEMETEAVTDEVEAESLARLNPDIPKIPCRTEGPYARLSGRESSAWSKQLSRLCKIQICPHPAQAVHHLQGVLSHAAHQQIPLVEVIQQKPLHQMEPHHMAGGRDVGPGTGAGVELTANGDMALIHIVHRLVLIDEFQHPPLQICQIQLRLVLWEGQNEAVVNVIVLRPVPLLRRDAELAQILRRVGHQAVFERLLAFAADAYPGRIQRGWAGPPESRLPRR